MSLPVTAAVLFDFDGTLAPNLDLPGMRRDVVAYTETCGVPAQVYADRYILEVIDAAVGWLNAQNQTLITADAYYQQAHQIILDIELGAAAETEPFDGVKPLLSRLNGKDIKVGVVTRNCRDAVLETFPDILDYVDVLHARGDVEYLKPDPRHLTTTLELLNVSAEAAVMVGDGQLDMSVGKSIGAYCVGVLSGSSDHAGLTSAGADLVLDDCLGLDALLPDQQSD